VEWENKLATVTVIDNDILISVEKVIYENAECIKVNFQKSNSKYKNLGVFEKNNIDQIFLETKNHIGKNVKVNCFDPDNKPGEWSANNWFKDIIPLANTSDIVSPSDTSNMSHVIEKGPCVKCGIYDHFVGYSEDFGKTWMHYKCRDK